MTADRTLTEYSVQVRRLFDSIDDTGSGYISHTKALGLGRTLGHNLDLFISSSDDEVIDFTTLFKTIQHTLLIKRRMREYIIKKKRDGTVHTPFISTPDDVINACIVHANISEDDIVYELGCGTGRVCTTMVDKCGCRVIGIEHNYELVKCAEKRIISNGVEHLCKVIHATIEDSFHLLCDATVIFMFLLPQTFKRFSLVDAIWNYIPIGCQIISYSFDMRSVHQYTKFAVRSCLRPGTTTYLYCYRKS